MQVKLIILLLSASLSAWGGWSARDVLADRAEARAIVKAHEAKDEAIAAARAIDRRNNQLRELSEQYDALAVRKAIVQERVINHEVIKYVQTTAAAVCGLDGDGVRIHNAAATAGMSEEADTAGGVDAAPGSATAAQLIPVIARNYGACNRNAGQLVRLQEWVRGEG